MPSRWSRPPTVCWHPAPMSCRHHRRPRPASVAACVPRPARSACCHNRCTGLPAQKTTRRWKTTTCSTALSAAPAPMSVPAIFRWCSITVPPRPISAAPRPSRKKPTTRASALRRARPDWKKSRRKKKPGAWSASKKRLKRQLPPAQQTRHRPRLLWPARQLPRQPVTIRYRPRLNAPKPNVTAARATRTRAASWKMTLRHCKNV